jgi:hypothetical protein
LRLAAAAVASALAVAASACGGGPEGGPVEGPGYETVLPSGWEETGDLEQAAISSQIRVDLESAWVRDEPVEGFRANANVVGDTVSPGTDVVQFAREQRDELLDSASIEAQGLDRAVRATPLGEVERTTLGGDPAAIFEIRNLSAVGKLRQREVVAIRGDRAHLITMTAPSSAFEQLEPEFEEILDSWQWTG